MVAEQRCYSAIVAYDGTDFLGYQIQATGRTVQGEIERVLKQIFRDPIRISGAGRTDAGVHAVGQVIAFKASWPHLLSDLQRALNAKLPPDIVVSHLMPVDEAFHPRFSALNRAYRYTILNQRWPSVLQRHYTYHLRERLDVFALNEASRVLIGSHDFASFGKPPQGNVTRRTVTEAKWAVVEELVIFDIVANAFLYRMVRRIVASLIKVGLGQWSVGDIVKILEARDLTRSAPPAPPHGLCLRRVTYPENVWTELM